MTHPYHRPCRLIATLAAAALLLGVLSAQAAQMPDFGPSISFDRSDLPVQMSDLRGKAAIVVFFQSWCPKCNVWSGKMFKQIEEAHADNRGVALLAIKTDGGGTREAKAYLKGRLDPTKWIIAADEGATYYKAVTGNDGLYSYVLVSPDGSIQETGNAGSMYREGPEAGTFALASSYFLPKLSGGEPFLPKDKTYPEPLRPAVTAAERGQWGAALKLASSLSRRPSVKEAAEGLRQDITAAAMAYVQKQKTILEDGDTAARFAAFQALERTAKTIRSTEAGKTAMSAARAASSDPQIRKEAAAQRAYNGVMARAARLQGQQRVAALAPALRALAKKYEGTSSGQAAAAEYERMKQAAAGAGTN